MRHHQIVQRRDGSLGFFWGGCEVDERDFKARNRVEIYPDHVNVWLLARRDGAKDSVEKVVDEFLKPVSTSWFRGVTKAIQPIPLAQIRDRLAAFNRPLSTTMSQLTVLPDVGDNPSFYLVAFVAPGDAPSEIPWPVKGCVESADWALSTSLAPQVTETPVSLIPPEEAREATKSYYAASKQSDDVAQQQALEALRRASGGSLIGDVAAGKLSWKMWAAIGAATVGTYYVWRWRRRTL